MVSRDIKLLEDKCWSGPSDIHQEERSDMPDLPTKLPRLEVQQQEEAADGPLQNRKTKILRDLYEQTPILDEQL